jgi:hypothetical protein
MLRTMYDLEDYAIRATDGTIGHVKDFYFDDERWVVRYLVVETGTWLSSRKVLISPIAIGAPDWGARVLPANLTLQQVKDSPDIDTHAPVSRQHEIHYNEYYRYPYYWGGSSLWGAGCYPGPLLSGEDYVGPDAQYRAAVARDALEGAARLRRFPEDPHLRSCLAVTGYHLTATDGGIGHVKGFLVDEDTWAIRYLIIDTSNWWIGHQVLISPEWIRDIAWSDRAIFVDVTQRDVGTSPAYVETELLNGAAEEGLHRHYQRPAYHTHVR